MSMVMGRRLRGDDEGTKALSKLWAPPAAWRWKDGTHHFFERGALRVPTLTAGTHMHIHTM